MSMRNIPYIFWIFQLANGVSGVEKLQLMVGDSVTLNSAKIPSKETIQWLFGSKRIAEIKDGSRDPQYYKDDRFEDRLELDKKTGSLTIKNISTYHSGNYIQNIADINLKNMMLQVTDGVKNVSVMKGDSVTLHTGVTGVHRDAVKWTFGNRDLNTTDYQTGDLIIKNIDNRQCGNYVLEINNNTMGLQRTYYVVLIDGVKKETLKEENNVNLRTGLYEIKGYDLILWKTADVIVAKINKSANEFLTLDKDDMRFGGRLELDRESGNLKIRESKTTDSGDYDLQMNSSTHSLLRTISVTVNNSGVSPGAVAGIIVGLLVFHWCLQL